MNTCGLIIEKARNIHRYRYDYSKVVYVDPDTEIIIICNEHGDFSQLIYDHLKGQGCPKCGLISLINNQQKTGEMFITEAQEIHKNMYNYDKIKFS